MSRAVGNFVYVNPIEQDGNLWSGHIVSRGSVVCKETTLYDCDLVTYHDGCIVEHLKYEGNRVHKLWFQNITKIEGVY